MTSSATISADGVYRYTLHRDIRAFAQPLKPFLVIALNPSTADASRDDATIRKLLAFGDLWGCTTLTVVNLFAFRTAYPDELWAAQNRGVDIVGPDNDRHLQDLIASHRDGIVLAAWGAAEKARERAAAVAKLLPTAAGAYTSRLTQCLAVNKDGSPKHPLYVSYREQLKPWLPPVKI